MKSFVVVLACAFLALPAKCHPHDEWDIDTEFLGIAIDAKACKTKCGQSKPNCVAWGYTASHERCTGWILNMDDDHSADSSKYYEDFYNTYGGYSYDSTTGDEFDYAGVTASPNITDSSPSNNTLEDCTFSLVDLGSQHTQSQQCAHVVVVVSRIYRGCIAWLWSSEDNRCEGLLLRDVSSGYEECGIP